MANLKARPNVEEFEAGGPGTDARRNPGPQPGKARSDKVVRKRTSIELDVALHREFRKLCFLSERTMGEVMEEMIRREVKKMKKKLAEQEEAEIAASEANDD